MKSDMNDLPTVLNVGTKSGCLTIIAGFEAYQHERAAERIAKLEEEKQKFISGEKSSWCNFDSIETFDRHIENEKNKQLYKIRCKCGREFFDTEEFFLRKKWRDCGDECGIRLKKEADIIASYPRVKSDSYDLISVNDIHDSLEIVECIDDHVEIICPPSDKRKKKDGIVYLKKRFRCKCYLCGREYEYLSDEFDIKKDYYGRKAEWGYYSDALCECRKDSTSFQWITVSLLKQYKIPYRVEFSFQDLLSEKGNPLRFDFVIFNDENKIKYLIECHGEQHYKLVPGCGGYTGLARIKKRDEIKRQYAKDKGILLIEIPYTNKSFEKQEEILRKNGIIKDNSG